MSMLVLVRPSVFTALLSVCAFTLSDAKPTPPATALIPIRTRHPLGAPPSQRSIIMVVSEGW